MAQKTPAREPIPNWLFTFKKHYKFQISKFFQSRIVYYPGAGFDGTAVQFFGSRHLAHCFVYADYGVTRENVTAQLEGNQHRFRGYTTLKRIQMNESELTPNGWKPHFTQQEINEGVNYWFVEQVQSNPYAFVEILCREAHLDNTHGPEALAILFLGGDGVATFDALFCQEFSRLPYAIVAQDHGFGGNYTQFGGGGMLEKLAIRANRFPSYLWCADGNTKPWEGYERVAGIEGAAGGMHRTLRYLYQKSSVYQNE